MCPVADNDATFKLFRDKGDFFSVTVTFSQFEFIGNSFLSAEG